MIDVKQALENAVELLEGQDQANDQIAYATRLAKKALTMFIQGAEAITEEIDEVLEENAPEVEETIEKEEDNLPVDTEEVLVDETATVEATTTTDEGIVTDETITPEIKED